MDSVCCCSRMPLLKEGEGSRGGPTVAGSVLVLELLVSLRIVAGCLLGFLMQGICSPWFCIFIPMPLLLLLWFALSELNLMTT